MAYNYMQGFFRPKNPKKYEGDPTKIIYRSGWELKAFMWCDTSPSVKSWSSEEVVVPYISPADHRYHRYFIDLKVRTAQDKVILIEIKPHAQTIPPVVKQGKKPTKRLLREMMEYSVNQAKWASAQDYAENRGWTFKVLTEYELGIK